MTRQLNIYAILISAIANGAILNTAHAQCAGAEIKPSPSSGLVVSVAKTMIQNNNIIIQFVVQNTTKSRVYLLDAIADNSQTAFLGSGAHVSFPSNVAGIGTCSAVETCLSSPAYRSLNIYSYIEPEDSLPFSFKYTSNSPLPEKDTISFSATLISRFTKPNGDPMDADPPRPIRFNFTFVPLCR